MLRKLLIDILTTKNGQSFDNGRVLGTLSVLAFIVFSAITVIQTHQFAYEQFGLGMGTLFAGVGINLKLKETSEPNEK